MFSSLKQKLSRVTWPLWTLTALVLVLFATNYIPGTFLSGWDNLHPEFNFPLNIQRSLFSVWQEYQGLGLLGGMGHASDLMHDLILLFLSTFLPESFLRYFWTFLMLWLGCVGMYVFLKKIVFQYTDSKLFPFLGALFYLLNLATLETFFAPFEAFIGHYAALPWLLYASITYFLQRSKRSLILFIVILFLATPQAYIPTLFVVYLLALCSYLLVWIITNHSFPFTRLFKLFSLIIIVNAFWLFPFVYFTFTNVQVTVNSKINQMATPIIYAQNKEFGDAFDVMQLKGFWYNNVDYTLDGSFDYMLEPWRNYSNNPAVEIVAYLLFACIAIGVVAIFRSRKKELYGFVGIFILAWIALGNATPPFSWINALLRDHISLLNEAFRFPYTKFSILTAFIFAVFFSLGVQAIVSWLKSQQTKRIFIGASVIAIIIVSFPMFTGNLIYNKEKANIPQAYFQLFDYMKTQDVNTRIADMPQYTFWGWNFYRWGIGGSGFLWYGIQQPILDRAFDVWSQTDENYYFELSQALYSKNPKALNAVLQKYQITWLLWDKSIINPSSPQALFYPEFQQLLTQLPMIHKVKTFGSDLELYKVTLNDHPQSFVFTTSTKIPMVNSADWNNNDTAYQSLGNYITSPQPTFAASHQTTYYPYRSFFSEKTSSDESFTVQNEAKQLLFQTTIPSHATPLTLTLPSYPQSEPIIPVTVTSTESAKILHVRLNVQPPTIAIDGRTIWNLRQVLPFETSLTLPVPASQSAQPIIVKINGVISDPLSANGTASQTSFLSLVQQNIISVSKGTVTYANIVVPTSAIHIQTPHITIPATAQQTTMTVTYPKINDNYLSLIPDVSKGLSGSCDNFRNGNVSIFPIEKPKTDLRIQTQNATACTSYYSGTLSHRLGYIVFINSQNISGRGLHFWILNENEKFAPIDTYLLGNPNADETFVLPPQDPFGKAYSLHFDNVSIGNDVSTNQLNSVQTYAIPYAFLTNMTLQTETTLPATTTHPSLTNVQHPNPSVYSVQAQATTPFILGLSQSYNPGWVAYANGGQVTGHIELNNWENGWLLPMTNNQSPITITIIYLPQYLEYLGWICLAILLIGTITHLFFSRSKKVTN